MQTQINPKNTVSGNETKIEVRTEAGRWQQPQAVGLKPALLPGLPPQVFNSMILPGRGVPFSPLND
jgi:hypothetical protein